MEKIRTGKLNPRALELPIEIHPIERAQKVTLKRLNHLLGFLSEKYPEAIQLYVVNLQSCYQSLTKSDHANSSEIDLASLITDLTYLAQYPDAATAYMNYYLELLDPKTQDN
ncbi:MAG: hypothetical protein NWE89_12185 [Candidatus Bathyarchaeota archaeon]|nr:hypothetical protein [Candidatus Bathyarchaeota archaeon]